MYTINQVITLLVFLSIACVLAILIVSSHSVIETIIKAFLFAVVVYCAGTIADEHTRKR